MAHIAVVQSIRGQANGIVVGNHAPPGWTSRTNHIRNMLVISGGIKIMKHQKTQK